jgi:hypothetical protein
MSHIDRNITIGPNVYGRIFSLLKLGHEFLSVQPISKVTSNVIIGWNKLSSD